MELKVVLRISWLQGFDTAWKFSTVWLFYSVWLNFCRFSRSSVVLWNILFKNFRGKWLYQCSKMKTFWEFPNEPGLLWKMTENL